METGKNQNMPTVNPFKARQIVHLFVVVCVIAITAAIWHRPRYLQQGAVDYKNLIGPPPAAGSVEAKEDLLKVMVLQSIRKPSDVERAKSEVEFTPFLFSRVIGRWFTSDNLPQTAALLREAVSESQGVVDRLKVDYARPRPFLADSKVEPCVRKEETFSYPSGHATNSMLTALILAEIFPDEHVALIDEAKSIGQDRVLAGVHYMTDVQAGQKIAEAMFNAMKQNESFKYQLERAKIECRFHPNMERFYVANGE
jgi:acid phosphatase (class A)